jgi:WD40 repeat protein/tRNA A-37 threonylcarbamoyl transferase component Bud32
MPGEPPPKLSCPGCGEPVPDDAPGGLCLKCLFALGTSPVEAVPSDSALPCRSFGDYELLEEIGRGGMGVIYKARQKSLGRVVAVKMLLFGAYAAPEVAQRFRTEAATAASLQHPNIVALHEVGAHEGQPYFSMEFIDGQSLAQLAAAQPLGIARAARYMKVVAEAIHYAHERGILHRDLKPSNVLIDLFDQPRITDFGLAKRLHHDSELTLSGQVLGSPNYMPPEQASAKRGQVGRRSDIYSLGGILYHLLTGRPPFLGETLTDTLQEVLGKQPISPRLLNPSVPRDLETICLKCLEKEPGRRYPTAEALALDLDHFLKGEPVRARPAGHVGRLWRGCRRKPALASFIAATALLLLALAIASPIAALRIDRARKLAEVRLYAADMYAAQQALENGNLNRARELLKAHWSNSGDPDLRGFEWRYLWHQCRGDSFHTFSGHSDVVRSVSFSADGQLLASGSADGSVMVWDVANRKLVATLTGHTSFSWSAISQDGLTLAGADADGVKLWDLATGQLLFTLAETGVARFAFSPRGTLLAIAYGSATFGDRIGGPIKLWDYIAHRVVRVLPEPGSRLAFSPDGAILAARSGDDAVKLWNVQSGKEMRRLDHTGEVTCLQFSPDGQTVAAGLWDGRVKLWNVVTGEPSTRFAGHKTIVWTLAFSPDGKTLATGSSDQTLRLWKVATGEELSRLIGHGSEVNAVAFAPDGRTLATGGDDSQVMLWSAAPKVAEPLITNVHQAPVFFSHGKLLATATRGGPVTVRDVATRRPIWVLESERLARSPGDEKTLATLTTNGLLRYWDVATQKLHSQVQLEGITFSTQHFRFALRGHRFAAADEEGFITLLDTTTGKRIKKFKASAGPYWLATDVLAFSPDGRLLATSGEGNSVRLWDVATQKELAVPLTHKGSAQGLAFSPDGSILASASWEDHTIGFLNVATRTTEPPLSDIKEGCSGVGFSPDGRTLAVACEEGTLRIWNLATRREVLVLKHGKTALRFVVFTPDGRTLVSVAEDGEMRLWDAPNPDASAFLK